MRSRRIKSFIFTHTNKTSSHTCIISMILRVQRIDCEVYWMFMYKTVLFRLVTGCTDLKWASYVAKQNNNGKQTQQILQLVSTIIYSILTKKLKQNKQLRWHGGHLCSWLAEKKTNMSVNKRPWRSFCWQIGPENKKLLDDIEFLFLSRFAKNCSSFLE